MDNFVNCYNSYDNYEVDITNYIANSNAIVEELGTESVYPIFTTELNRTTLTYVFEPTENENINESQLQIRVISKNYDEAKKIEFILRRLMDMKNKKYITAGNTCFHSQLVGGGILFNSAAQMYENMLLFQIKWKWRK